MQRIEDDEQFWPRPVLHLGQAAIVLISSAFCLFALLVCARAQDPSGPSISEQFYAARIGNDALVLGKQQEAIVVLRGQLDATQKALADEKHRVEGLNAAVDAAIAERDEARKR